MAAKRKAKKPSPQELAREADLKLVVELGEEYCHHLAPRDWAEQVLDRMERDGQSVHDDGSYHVHGALQELGWYVDPDQTEDDD